MTNPEQHADEQAPASGGPDCPTCRDLGWESVFVLPNGTKIPRDACTCKAGQRQRDNIRRRLTEGHPSRPIVPLQLTSSLGPAAPVQLSDASQLQKAVHAHLPEQHTEHDTGRKDSR